MPLLLTKIKRLFDFYSHFSNDFLTIVTHFHNDFYVFIHFFVLCQDEKRGRFRFLIFQNWNLEPSPFFHYVSNEMLYQLFSSEISHSNPLLLSTTMLEFKFLISVLGFILLSSHAQWYL